MNEDNVLEMEARLKDFISSGLEGVKKNIKTFAKEGGRGFDEVNKKVREGEGAFGKFKDQVAGNLAGFRSFVPQLIAGGLAVGSLTALVSKSVAAFEEQNSSNNKLINTLRATGKEYEYNVKQLQDLASYYQQTTGFADDMVQSAQSMLLTFRNISSDVFPRVLQASVDLAAFMGTDLVNAAQSLGQALEMPETAGRKLRAMNILLTDSETKLLQSFVDTGRQADAQTFILQKLESATSGTAVATVNATVRIKNFIGEVMESVGSKLIGVYDALADVLDRVSGNDTRPKLTGIKERIAATEAEIASLERLEKQVKQTRNVGLAGRNATISLGLGPSEQAELDATTERIAKLNARVAELRTNYTGEGRGRRLVPQSAAEIAEINKELETLRDRQKELSQTSIGTIKSDDIPKRLAEARTELVKLREEAAKPAAKTSSALTDAQVDQLAAARKIARDAEIAAMEDGRLKELAIEGAKYDDLKEQYKGFNQALALIRAAHLNNVDVINRNADQREMERQAQLRAEAWEQLAVDAARRVEFEKQIEEQRTAYAAVLYDDALSNLDRQYAAERAAHESNAQALFYIDLKYAEMRKQTQLQMLQSTAQGITANLAVAAGQYKKFAGVYKSFAQFSNTIDTYASATAAYKSAAAIPLVGWLLAPAAAAAAIAAGVARGTAISSQKFEKGGFPKGKDAIITVNENGQEAVLNANATRNLGEDRINALNAGKSITQVITMDERGRNSVISGDSSNVSNVSNEYNNLSKDSRTTFNSDSRYTNIGGSKTTVVGGDRTTVINGGTPSAAIPAVADKARSEVSSIQSSTVIRESNNFSSRESVLPSITIGETKITVSGDISREKIQELGRTVEASRVKQLKDLKLMLDEIEYRKIK